MIKFANIAAFNPADTKSQRLPQKHAYVTIISFQQTPPQLLFCSRLATQYLHFRLRSLRNLAALCYPKVPLLCHPSSPSRSQWNVPRGMRKSMVHYRSINRSQTRRQIKPTQSHRDLLFLRKYSFKFIWVSYKAGQSNFLRWEFNRNLGITNYVENPQCRQT